MVKLCCQLTEINLQFRHFLICGTLTKCEDLFFFLNCSSSLDTLANLEKEHLTLFYALVRVIYLCPIYHENYSYSKNLFSLRHASTVMGVVIMFVM